MASTEENNRRKRELDAMREAMYEYRRREQNNQYDLKAEKINSESEEESRELWNKVDENVKNLAAGGLEAYNEWMTAMMKIASASGDLNKAMASSLFPDKLGNSIKKNLTNLKDRMHKSTHANQDPELSVELFDKDGKPQVAKMHAVDDAVVNKVAMDDNGQRIGSVQDETQKMFEQWLAINHYTLADTLNEEGEVCGKEIQIAGSGTSFTEDNLQTYKKDVEDPVKGFAKFVEERLHEAGLKKEFTVDIYKAPEPAARPSA